MVLASLYKTVGKLKNALSSIASLLVIVNAQVRLGKGGSTMVYAHVASNYFTIKGPNFCGRSASHVIFDKVVTLILNAKHSIKPILD